MLTPKYFIHFTNYKCFDELNRIKMLITDWFKTIPG